MYDLMFNPDENGDDSDYDDTRNNLLEELKKINRGSKPIELNLIVYGIESAYDIDEIGSKIGNIVRPGDTIIILQTKPFREVSYIGMDENVMDWLMKWYF